MPTRYSGPHHRTYTVSGSLEEVAAVIERRKEAGTTEWEPLLTWESDGNGNVTSVVVNCEIHIEMPDWDGYADAPEPDRASWDRFFAALTEHEDGHVQIVHSWLDDIDFWLSDNTETTVDAAFEHIVGRLQDNSDEYDVFTKHGTERGCVIVVGAPADDEQELVEE